MPTIDQLAPATAASDSDELLVSQGGIARKITRAQVLAGVQPQLAIGSGNLLGRISTGTGGPEPITIGANLALNAGTLTASGTSFLIPSLSSGTVPASGDTVPLGQAGKNASVTYSQFMSGLCNVANIDGSQLLVTPTGGKSPSKLADWAANTVPLAGATLTGALTLAGDPTATLQAATKRYVDNQFGAALSKTGGTLTGALTLAADPAASLQAATKQYVDNQLASLLPKAGGTLSGALTLPADPTASLQAATKQYVDNQLGSLLPKVGGTLSGALTLSADPTASLQAATKQYVDAQVATTLPKAGGSLTGALALSADPTAALQAATKQYVDTRVLRSGDSLTGLLTLSANPTAALHAATKAYVDAGDASALPKAGGTLTGSLVLPADPTTALQAATKQYVDTRLLRAGDTLTGPLLLAADPTAALQAATKSYVDTQVAASLPKAGGTLTGALTLAANPASALQAAPKQYVDAQVATALPTAGGTLTGALTLAADPSAVLHAATKRYVDAGDTLNGVINVKAAPYNARLNGTNDDTAAFKAAYQAAPAGSAIYVPNGIAVMQNPSAWGIALTKRVKWIVDGTTLADGTSLANAIPGGNGPANNFLPGIVAGNSGISAEFAQTGSQPNDFAVLHSSYVVNHNGGPTGGAVITNTRNDTIIYNSPNNFVWGGLDRLLWCGVQGSSANHVARYAQTVRQSLATDASGKPLPQPQLWAACLEYRDTTGRPSSWANASLTVEMDWFGNGADDGNARQIQSLVVGQHDTNGAPVEISTVVGVYLVGGHAGHAYRVFGVDMPFSVAAFDTASAQQLPGAAAIRLAAGHAIAFEASNSNYLAYDSASGALRWHQGGLSYVVGKGITVGWMNVYGGSGSLPNYIAGNIVFLVGGGAPYTITLPAASSVPAGVGFTFSVLGSAPVSIVPSGGDAIDAAPVVLYPNDRYHVVSDGGGTWREVFHSNAVNPHFTAPPVLPSYTVGALPGSPGAGAMAFVSNGRKPNEGPGGGTGVEVFFDGTRWISTCSGAQVQA